MRNLRLSIQTNELAQVVFAEKTRADQLINYNSVVSSNQVDPDFYREFYASDNNPLKVTREIQFLKLIKTMRPHLYSLDKKTLLDVGCGQGDFINIVQKELSSQVEAFGIEPSISQETQNLKKLSLEQVQKSSALPHQYDILTALDVFEHFQNPVETLKQFSALLKPDGLLVLMVPNKDSLLYRIGKILVPIFPSIANQFFGRLYQIKYPPPHFFYYNAKSLRVLLSSSYDIQYVGYQSQLPLKGIPTRFWGLSKILKPIFMIGAVFYRIFSPYSLNDSLIIFARKLNSSTSEKSANV